MTTPNRSNIRKALVEAAQDFLIANETIVTPMETFAGLPIIPESSIAWENEKFSPRGKETWASVFYVPNVPDARTIGVGGFDSADGFMQIDFNVAPDSGEKAHMDWERKAEIYFHPGRSFFYAGHSVLVTSSGLSQGRHVENFYRKSLTVAFRSQLKRNQI